MAKRSRKRSQHVRESSSKTAPDYPVGYGRPPQHSQFKPGQSGNPKGRPKGHLNVRTVVEKALNERIEIKEGDRTRWVSKLDGVVVNVVNKALRGDPKSQNMLTTLLRSTRMTHETPEPTMTEPVTAHDDEILADFLRRKGEKP
jgi:hypothetical protein